MADETTVESTETASQAEQAPVPETNQGAAAQSADAPTTSETSPEDAPAAKKTAKKTVKKTTAKRTAKKAVASEDGTPTDATATAPEVAGAAQPADETTETAPAKKTAAKRTTAKKTAAKKTTTRRTTKKAAASEASETTESETAAEPVAEDVAADQAPAAEPARSAEAVEPARSAEPVVTKLAASTEATEPDEETEDDAPAAPAVLFQAPTKTTPRRRTRKAAAKVETPAEEPVAETPTEESAEPDEAAAVTTTAKATKADRPETAEEASEEATDESSEETTEESGEGGGNGRRRRRRGGRRRRKGNNAESDSDEEASADDSEDSKAAEDDETDSGDEQQEGSGSSRRRRRRRRAGEAAGESNDDPQNTVTKVRTPKAAEDQITSLSGSTRLEAKKQRRREGREAGRRRAPIVSEAEFLARRESVERVMVIRQREDLTQIAVLEDKVLVEHYVARESQTSLIGNVYLGRVQNVLPSMEAAFIDIGKGRNAVLYAGEVNWHALGWKEGQPRKIESVLSSGQKVLVQVTKDPIGHKGARLTSQISLAGRFLVYVPDGTTSGISRKLPDTERNRLKALLKEIVPDTAGVIVRTAAEGAAEDELTRDVERLKARWEDIEKKAGGNAPQLLYGEPDLTLKVVRDLFTEDFAKLVVSGKDAWETVQGYVHHVAPDLEERLEAYEGAGDAFAAYRIDEQIAKGVDRKVWLPSGGSLIIDRTEAMTVVDVNTGKFTGSGGNLEETVTKNNLEAAEEIVRQLRLRDIGGIIVVDFIDMVLESNRDLVLRRLVECLGRDRTRHQVAEVTSLGLVQMTRKRIGTGLLEAFSETCEACSGRGLVIHDHPVEPGKSSGIAPDEPRSRRRRGGRGKGGSGDQAETPVAEESKTPSPAEFAAMAGQQESGDTAGDAAAAPAAETTPVTEPSESSDSGQAAEAEPTDVVAAPPAEPEAPKVTTRTRSRRSRRSAEAAPVADETPAAPAVPEPEAPAEPAASTEAPAPVDEQPATPEPEPTPEPTPAEEPAEAPVPAEAAKPKVVTRVRRGASRAVVSTGEGKVLSAAETVTVTPGGAPISTPPPKVVTRVRGGARRGAGGQPADEQHGDEQPGDEQ